MMSSQAAEVLAIEAVTWLISKDDLFPIFLNNSGADIADFQSRLTDPVFLGHVMDFILSADEFVLECAQQTQSNPQKFWEARQMLPGGELMNWT